MPRKKYYKKKGLKGRVQRNTRMIRSIKRVIERKQLVTSDAGVDCNTTGAVIYLSGIAQGDTDSSRDGCSVYAKSLHCNITCQNTHGTPEDCYVRIMLLRMRQTDGRLPVLAGEILEAISIRDVQDWDHRKNIDIIYDNVWVMDTDVHSLMYVKVHKSKLNCETTFTDSAGTIDKSLKNHYFLVFFSSVAGTTNDPLLDYDCRFTYDD